MSEHEAAKPDTSLTKKHRLKRHSFSLPLAERLAYFVSPEPNTGCWLWLGCVDKEGYGKIAMPGQASARMAHRISYELHVGPIPEGLELDHKCRMRCCVNFQHLEPVTHLENMRRGVNIGAHLVAAQKAKTHCPKGHPYDEANTGPGHGSSDWRVCRACARDNDRNTRKARRGIVYSHTGNNGSSYQYERGCRCAECKAAHIAKQHRLKASKEARLLEALPKKTYSIPNYSKSPAE